MAPSRRKKVLRESMLTHAFFNQVGNNDGCSSCPTHSHSHATSSSTPRDPNPDKLAEAGRGDKALRIDMSAPWMDNYLKLAPEERQSFRAAVLMRLETSDPPQALQLAYEQMSKDPAMADQFPSMSTFDLSNLDEVVKTYDKLCTMFKEKEEHEMSEFAELVGDLAVIASDAKRSSNDRLTAELEMQNLNIYSKITVPLNACLRQVQLFNTEKRFGFVEESYQAICNDDMKQRGADVPADLPLSFRQQWNNPSLPPKPASKSSKKEKKKLSGMEALDELQRNCKLAVEEMQELKKTISNAEKPVELPSVPASFTYRDVPVPEDIPKHIRQRFFDGDFAHQQVMALEKEAYKLLLTVRSAFATWYTTGNEVWEYGKKHVHEMPIFREYEYTRTSLRAQFYLASRQEVKIVEFYSSKGAPDFPRAMNEAFKLGSLSLEEFEKDWEMRCLKLQNTEFPSVDKMIAERDEMVKETAW